MGMNPVTKDRMKRRLALRDGERCAICGKSAPLAELTLDHIIPRRDGGPNSFCNLRLACYRCNHGRHNRLKR